MTIHQCPKCELRFDWLTEVDDHCRRDYPEFRHEYPAAHHEPPPSQPLFAHRADAQPAQHGHLDAAQLLAWTMPKHARDAAPRGEHA